MTSFDPDFQARLDALVMGAKGAGFDPRIESGFRSPTDQVRAINQVARRIYGRPASMAELVRGIPGYAAAPGQSRHQSGQAADFRSGPSLDWMRANAGRYGVGFPIPTDAGHAEARGPVPGPVQSDVTDPSAIDQSPAQMAMRGGGGGAPAVTGSLPAPAGSPPMQPPMMPYTGMMPDDVQMARQMGQQLMQQGTSTAPVGHWTQALARALQGASGAGWMADASQGQRQGQNQANQLLAQALQGGDLKSIGTQALSNPWTAPMGQQIALKQLTADKTTAQKDFEAGQKNPAFRQYQVDMRQASRPQVTVDTRAETKFSEEAGKQQAKRLNEAVEAGQKARTDRGDLERLAELSGAIGTQGAVADWKAALGPYATAFGIKIDALDDIQAFSAILSKLAPTMRPPGSGATSDFEFRQFLNALPKLAQTETGRKLILDQLRAINDYTQAVGDISDKGLSRDLTPQQVRAEIAKLGNPLALYKRTTKDAFKPAPGDAGRFAQPQAAPAAQALESVRQQLKDRKIDPAQIMAEAKAKLQANPQARAVIIERLQALGLPVEGF